MSHPGIPDIVAVFWHDTGDGGSLETSYGLHIRLIGRHRIAPQVRGSVCEGDGQTDAANPDGAPIGNDLASRRNPIRERISMILMLAGLVLFVAIHILTARRKIGAAASAQLGTTTYRVIHGVVALAGVLLIAYGYGQWRAEGPAQLYDPPVGLRHLALLLMLIASIATVAALVPSHLKAWLKFPFLVAIKTWALAHLLANGDAATVTLAVVILAWAVVMRIMAKRRGAPLPVAPAGWGGDIIAIVGGVVLYAALAFWFHPYIVGVPVMG